jgi:hypothetical protein
LSAISVPRWTNLPPSPNAESRRYREAGDAEQQIVAGVLVAKLVGGLRRDIFHLISQIMLLGTGVIRKGLSD